MWLIRFACSLCAALHTTFTAALPISLTTSDGQLDLVKMTSISSVSYPLSLTELRLTFRNPKDKVIEGRFQVVLPSGASVARFAMAIGNEWREGEVVERKFARKVYENFLLKKQDPALLELSAGNLFSARIFPVCNKNTFAFARSTLMPSVFSCASLYFLVSFAFFSFLT